MAPCCNPRGCDQVFNDRFALRMASRYRKKGLDKTARHMVDLIAANGLDGATVLEIGGGVGDIQIELLKRGASRITNLELSGAYEVQAQQLLADSGMAERVQRRMVDIAASPQDVEPADIVVLHRVVCCYRDYAKLLAAVADHAGRQVVFSHPPGNLLWRAVVGAQNLMFKLRGLEFRVFAHAPAAMLAVLAEHGMRPATARRSIAWHISVAER